MTAWIFTFGHGQRLRSTNRNGRADFAWNGTEIGEGFALHNRYVRIEAEHDEARARMVAIFGPVWSDSTACVLRDVRAERQRQEAKFPDQHLPDGTSDALRTLADGARRTAEARAESGQLTWRAVLHEEYYEASAEVDPAKLRAELVQVAAVAVRWVEDLDRRKAECTHGADCAVHPNENRLHNYDDVPGSWPR